MATHNGGQLQVNFLAGHPRAEFIPLNALKAAEAPFFPATGSPGTDWAALLTASGYPSAMPAGAAFWRKYVYIYGAVNDTWEFYYPGAHTCRVVHQSGGTISEATIGSGHKRYTIASVVTAGTPFLCAVDITAMSGSDWSAGLSLYKTSNQTDYDADPDGFDPICLSHYGYGTGKTPFGIIRTMQLGGGFTYQKLDAQKHEVSDCSWLSELVDVRNFAGTATKTLNHYTTGTRFPGSPAVWADGQIVQFYMTTRPTVLAITATTMGATTSFACTAHGLSNGEEVELERGSKPTGQLLTAMDTKSSVTGLPLKWAVTVTDANNFTIPINSTGFSAVGAFNLFPLVTAGDGTLAQKRCISADINGQFDSSYGASVVPGVVSGCYHSQFDAIVLRGNSANINPGYPLEIQAKFCNKLNAHWYLSVPMYMQGAEERAYITRARSFLNAGLLLILVKANEIWNSAFNASAYAASLAAARGFGSVDNQTGHGIMVNDLADSAATALGALDTTYRVGMELQNSSNYASELKTIKCGFLSGYVNPGTPGTVSLYPANKVDFIATAPYIRGNFSNPAWISANYPGWVTCLQNYLAGNTRVAFDWFTDEMLSASSTTLGTNQPLDKHVNAGLTGFIDLWVAGKSAYTGRRGGGIEIWNYEGGDHNEGADDMDGGFPSGGVTAANIFTFLCAYKRSAQFGWLQGRVFNSLKLAGVVWPSLYTAVGPWSTDKMWGNWPTNDIYETAPQGWEVCYNLNKGVRRFKLKANP